MTDVQTPDRLYAVKWHDMWIAAEDVQDFFSMVRRYWIWDVLFTESLVCPDLIAIRYD